MKNLIITGTIVYIIGAIATYGYAYKTDVKEQNKIWPRLTSMNEAEATSNAFFDSLVWPVYLSLHFSYVAWNK